MFLRQTEQPAEEEAADAAAAADEAGHQADVASEALRQKLEDRAVAHAEGARGDEEAPPQIQRLSNSAAVTMSAAAATAVEHAERADAAELVGERAAEGPTERADERAEGGHLARLHGLQSELVAEVDREGRREADEAAEADRVEKAEPVGVLLAEQAPSSRRASSS